jgi:hypothetical protein
MTTGGGRGWIGGNGRMVFLPVLPVLPVLS